MHEIRDISDRTLLTVTISVVSDAPPPTAHMTYSAAQLHARRGRDKIEWKCENGPFVIQFLTSAPLGKVHIHSDGKAIKPIPVPGEAPIGTHKYAVAVYSDGIVYIDAACPEIIIED